MLSRDSRSLMALLAVMVALGPLSTDLYLPALPAMVDGLDSSVSAAQLTLSSYLVGFSLFHLVCGPLADRFGRKPVLAGGLLLFAAASVGCALASDMQSLILWRFLQGVGACTGPTLGRAMVRDIYAGRAAKALALLAAIMALAPVVAPTLGGWLLTVWSWRSLFWLLAAYALFGVWALWRWLPETLPHVQPLRFAVIRGNMLTLMRSREFNRPVLAAAIHYAGAFAFLSGASFVLIDLYEVPVQRFGLWFMFIVVGYIGGNLFTVRWGSRWPAGRLMLCAGLLAGVAGSVMVLLVWLGWRHPLALVLPMAFYTASVGIAMPQAMTQALLPFANMAGTASALMGFAQMGISALAGVLVGMTLTDSAMPMALVIAALGWTACLLFGWLGQAGSDPETTVPAAVEPETRPPL